ncbi:hypothetical protein ACLBKU_09820 [Erythrobacter sp. NE805]|uniref:hypothetical protein n=1 Tax=Erythrobacter sp. NE805 TaxID=3389875 RepID=UPI00396B2801
MKRYAILASFAVLAACSKPASEAPADEETPAAAETAAAAMTTANGSPAGTYTVVDAKGTEGTSVLNADGTYVDTAADGAVTEGRWAVVDGRTCFTAGEGKLPTCWTESAPGADGSFTATSENGESVTVKPKT